MEYFKLVIPRSGDLVKGLLADIAAILHAVKMNLRHTGIRAVDRLAEIGSASNDGEHAPTCRHQPVFANLRSRMTDGDARHRPGVVCPVDDPARFGRFGISARRDDDA